MARVSRRLIAVSWAMPPALFPRSIQVARTLKGLGELGWSMSVVTPRINDMADVDFRDPLLRDVYGGLFDVVPVDFSNRHIEHPDKFRRWSRRLRNVNSSDDMIWADRAVEAVKAVAAAEGCDVVVTFAQPWRDHLVGIELKRSFSRLPWVAHFSDPWTDSPYFQPGSADVWEAATAEEREVLRTADAVIFTNDYTADLVMRKYPVSWRSKVYVIPHAMDPDLLGLVRDGIIPAPKVISGKRKLKMTHVGQLFLGRRTPLGLLEALMSLQRHQRLQDILEITFIGEGSGFVEAKEKTEELGLGSVVSFTPRVPYFESLKAMDDADVLLLIDAPAEINVFLPSKLVDYIMFEKPILALTPAKGSSADLVRRMGYWVIPPDDPAAIAAALELLVDQWLGSSLQPSDSHREIAGEFHSANIARAFDHALEGAIEKSRKVL